MRRLWRSVVILALCLTAVVVMRIFLLERVEIARNSDDAPEILVPIEETK